MEYSRSACAQGAEMVTGKESTFLGSVLLDATSPWKDEQDGLFQCLSTLQYEYHAALEYEFHAALHHKLAIAYSYHENVC